MTIELQTPSGYKFRVYGAPNRETIEQHITQLSDPNFRFSYEHWRHGGSYTNVIYPSGACGCIASKLHTISGQFEIACDPRPDNRLTYRTREDAANAEREIVLEMWKTLQREVI